MAITLDGTNGITTPALENDGVTTVAPGSASAPAITTDGDTNTGIFFPAADTIAFAEGGAEAVRIDSSGNVGIGTTSPSGKLHVTSSSFNPAYLETSAAGSDNVQLRFKGTTGERWAIGNNIAAGGAGLNFDIYDLANSANRMRIDSSGNLLVGTTSQVLVGKQCLSFQGSTNNGFVIDNSDNSGSAQHITIATSGAVRGSITSNGTTTSFNTSSDYRLKEDVQPMTGALATVAQLKPCTYTWKENGSAGQGFIAHELKEVVPDCVTGEKDATDADGNPVYQGVDTSFLVATLTAAIQELSAKNDALEARIAALEGAQA
jgi:hypothetical protein